MRIQRFGHAAIEVGDLGEAETFYRDTFGFAVRERYPEDGEVLLAVGQADHLLLHSAAADPHVEGQGAGAGLHHAAFQLVEGHREICAVRRRLDDLGIRYQEEDHDGDTSLYFRDPHGNLLEVYPAPGTTPRFATDADRFAAARRFVYGNARPVDRAIFEHRYDGAPASRVRAALEAHRNPDGGFGNALEPDVRASASQPLHTLTGLELLREAGIRAPDVADSCCAFFSTVATERAWLPALLPGAFEAPLAAHWQGPFALEPNPVWTIGCLAELAWHGARHAWFEQARGECVAALDAIDASGAHELRYLLRFAAMVLDGDRRKHELARLGAALDRAAWFVRDVPVDSYGLTPLHFAPTPDDPMRSWFADDLIEAHLDDLLDAQQGDGGWPIRFQAATDAAAIEWRGRCTLEALAVLGRYGRLQ